MRFWPGWSLLKDLVAKKAHGRVLSASFQRLSSAPDWSTKFYRDPSRTGGALVDLHIHDADLIQYLFGAPEAVTTSGSIDHLSTLYHYKNGPQHVAAEGGWNHTHGFPFRMRYVVVFERATLDFDLLRKDKLMISKDGDAKAVAIDTITGYDGEVRHFIECCARGRKQSLAATMADAARVSDLLDAERASLSTGRTRALRTRA
jgi:predicted dehydrogenase